MHEQKDIALYLSSRLEQAKTDLSKKIYNRDKLNKEIEELQHRIRVLDSELKQISTEANVSRKESNETKFDLSTIKPNHKKIKKIKRATIASTAYEVLKEANKPLHLHQITELIIQKGDIQLHSKTPQVSVNTALIRRKDLFKSLGRGLWEIQYEADTE